MSNNFDFDDLGKEAAKNEPPRSSDEGITKVEVEPYNPSDDIHLDRCWSTNSPPFGWVNTLFHRKAECWSS
jgi:hypothetical protein